MDADWSIQFSSWHIDQSVNLQKAQYNTYSTNIVYRDHKDY